MVDVRPAPYTRAHRHIEKHRSLRRRASRLVIGWLCGIGLAFGLMFEARSVPRPAIVHWLRSPTGLYVQSGAALVFQLSGGALVVRDVVRAEKNPTWLDYWFAELDHAIGDVDAEQQARRAETNQSMSRCSRLSRGSASLRGRRTSWLVTSPGPGRPSVAQMDLAHVVRSGPAPPGHRARRHRQPVRHLAAADHDVVDADPG